MAKIKNLNDLFLHTLKDIYYAEKQIVKFLPKMAKKSTAAKLSNAFQSHLKESVGHVTKLEQIFELLGEKARGVKCEAIDGIISESKGHIDEIEDGAALDAGLIASAQAIEHYEMTRYGTLKSWGLTLGLDAKITKLLSDILVEEEEADQKLTQLGQLSLNKKAA